MTRASTSTPAFFEAKYKHDADPWRFSSDPVELARYDAIVAALTHRRYRRGFEPGCSLGVLTERLAGLCDSVEAIDFSPTALERAQARCASLPHVALRCLSLPERIPPHFSDIGGFDLLVLSEIGYYFTAPEWARITGALIEAAAPGTTLLASHWLGRSADHQLAGDEVHAILRAHPGLQLEYEQRHPTFRLDRWVRR